MHRILAVAKREFLARARSKAFLLGTLLLPLAVVGWIMAPDYFASKAQGARDVLVLDQSGDPELGAALARRLAEARFERGRDRRSEPLARSFSLAHETVPAAADVDALREERRRAQPPGRELAFLVLRAGVLAQVEPEYHGQTLRDPALVDFERVVGAALAERRLAQNALDSETIRRVVEPPRLDKRRLRSAGGVAGDDAENVALIMLATMYTVTFLYGMWVMRGVASDKRSRIVEVLLTAAKPVELMTGKLLGIGAVGLAQCAIWVAAAALLSLQGVAVASALGFQLPEVAPRLLAYFLLYFVLGFAVYAALYALAGAASTNSDEAQQVQMPLSMLAATPMMVFFIVLRDPGGSVSVALSLVPWFAPTLMMLRLAISEPPAWQVAASVLGMAATAALSLWMTAKIFRAGILMSGKRQTLAELVRWLRYA